MTASTAVIVFARAPQLGRVKTRLIPALGERGALDLYRAMLRHALQIGRDFSPDALILACTPDADDPQLQALGEAVGATLQTQHGADLGARMRHSLQTALRDHQAALLIGSDCPSLHSNDLRQASDCLIGREHAQMVFIPATDGGYVLVGATEPCAVVFEDMPWGGDEVMKLTRQRLREACWQWQELEPHSDIDRPQDLSRLPSEFVR